MSSVYILEVDAGNSALKWRVLKEELPVDSGRFLLEEHPHALKPVLEKYPDLINSARVVSVAGEDFNHKLKVDLHLFGVESVCFAEVERQRAGVRCGYRDLNQLGVDRWVAVLAAAQEFSGPLVVIDAGSAITIDFVSAGKEHVGGYILPGWGLLYDALVVGTAIPNERIPLNFQAETIAPGLDSQQSIGMARLLMCASSVNAAVQGFTVSKGRSAQLVCTGGDSLKIMPHLQFEAEYRPDLVLDGLKVALG